MNRIDFIKNDHEYMFLGGTKNDCIFIFIHGYRSSPLDLMPLACELNHLGYNCSLLELTDYIKPKDETINKYATWRSQLLECTNYYGNYGNIYLIGFSIGATLALDISREVKIKGIFGISTFLQPKNSFSKNIINILNFLKIDSVPRFIQTTCKSTIKELKYDKYLSIKEMKHLIDDIENNCIDLEVSDSNIILLHSIDDKVANYKSVSNLILKRSNIKLITFRKLNHFLQFDIPVQKLSKFVEETLLEIQDTEKFITEIDNEIEYISNELNHWTSILYKLIVGFFSVFGALVYFSLSDIINTKPSTPYFLLSYSLINSVFVLLSSLYFFYINRANVFQKHFIEPYRNYKWILYKTNKFLSGDESISLTKNTSIAIIGLPIIVSLSSLLYVFYLYVYHKINFNNIYDNLFLMAGFSISLILFILSIINILSLKKYTDRELYALKIQKFKNISESSKVMQLISSVVPGNVVQPNHGRCRKND